MDLSLITPSDFKTYFRRDFPYLPADPKSYCEEDSFVLDSDIEKAFTEAKATFNQALFGDDETIRISYLYLTAHYLVVDIRASANGLSATGSFPLNSRSVGNVSESYDIPDAYKKNPQLAYFSSTPYGMKYLSIALPNLVGNVGAVAGWTTP